LWCSPKVKTYPSSATARPNSKKATLFTAWLFYLKNGDLWEEVKAAALTTDLGRR
jgi:hypothetical protein